MKDITYIGEPVSDSATFKQLPIELQHFLLRQNGVVAYLGGIHIRGCCHEPAWHSLREVWHGETAFHKIYPVVKETDIPFAQDAVGNQFLLRAGKVWFLDTETGQMEPLKVDFERFIVSVERFPNEALDLSAVATFRKVGTYLQPGELLAVYPPTCIQTDGDLMRLTRMPVETRLHSLADLFNQIRRLRPGQKIRLRTDEPRPQYPVSGEQPAAPQASAETPAADSGAAPTAEVPAQPRPDEPAAEA
ncbi:SMI1/KNR4 family protein [Hymenobacter sp. B81]|uniref:SMI1/KNR4 family protein n=1 Tax=Hymenobacter sp. B81 TaxID=3344878 RepID=UPI0037DCA25B